MIRVAYIIWSLGLGGAEQVVIRLAAALDRRRFLPLIICLNEPGPYAPQAVSAGVEVIALSKRGPVDPWLLVRLVRLLHVRRIDVVHTHLWGANLWGRLAALVARVPVIMATEHNVDTWKRRYHFILDRWLARRTTTLVAVSHQVRRFYEEDHRVGRGRWQVIYNGVAAPATLTRRRGVGYRVLGIPEDAPVVGLIGRLVPTKAPELFVEAVAIALRTLPALRGLIVGDGPVRPQTEAYVRERGLSERIIFTGRRDDVSELLAGMDVLAFSSEREGLSMAMLEGMAAGVPIVATRVGGTPELIESGATGVLVEPGSVEALAEAMATLLQDPARAETIRHAARERIITRFSLSAMVASHEQLYASGTPRARTVALIIDHLDRGGAQRQLVALAQGLPHDQWAPVVIALSTERMALADELRASGVPVYGVPQRGKLDLVCLWRLVRLLRQLRPSLVHTWLFTADTYGRLAAWLAGVPGIVCAIRNTVDDLPRRYRLVNRWLTRITAQVTINAEAIRPRLVAEAGVPAQKIRTIYNGIDAAAIAQAGANGFDPRAWGVPPRARIVAMVARLAPQKDPRTFLEAAARVAAQQSDVHFMLVGEGELRPQVERWVAEFGLTGRAHVVGERSDAQALLSHSAVCVLATHHEGCSNVVMEAMACGRPVIATRIGGNEELIVEGVTGLLVPPRDPDALAQAMQQLLGESSRADAMGAAGRERMAREFNVPRMVQAHVALYEDVAGVREGGSG